ncbi:phosphatase PAP2 family protein [Priestia koreensis]|uniref:phosphatase PAP2 family protein n=1 Tax=Priestia koreensis TaxID=284581 RepID=UPI001F58B92A|nr:phosphatase PAP2 family protein [Priestia koreensis]MCM3003443.1 phosphatase PAP2 family protein [Priestia koreensis]UNL86233.1 phosphatase PAP2 family protein [Priestia koreensis]
MKQRGKDGVYIIASLVLFICLLAIFKLEWVQALDQSITDAMFNKRGDEFTALFVFMSTLGSWKVTGVIGIIICLYLLVKKQNHAASLLAIIYIMSRVLNWIVKELVHRPRPTVEHLVAASSYSFPSGHAMNSMSFFGFILVLILYYQKRSVGRALACILLGIIIFLIGLSRIYVGVHFFTDVLAGFALGFTLVTVFKILLKKKLPK